MVDIEAKLSSLKPTIIDPYKCTPAKSLYQQILNTANERLKHQEEQWFNLGNGQKFNDPISAAEYLLKREYGDSFLFKEDRHEPVFIPSEFMSCQYVKKSGVAVLDYRDIKLKFIQTLENRLPDARNARRRSAGY